VQERVSILGVGGGYILGPSHSPQNEIPAANIPAMCDPELQTI